MATAGVTKMHPLARENRNAVHAENLVAELHARRTEAGQLTGALRVIAADWERVAVGDLRLMQQAGRLRVAADKYDRRWCADGIAEPGHGRAA